MSLGPNSSEVGFGTSDNGMVYDVIVGTPPPKIEVLKTYPNQYLVWKTIQNTSHERETALNS
jgi:hypothetical protein